MLVGDMLVVDMLVDDMLVGVTCSPAGTHQV